MLYTDFADSLKCMTACIFGRRWFAFAFAKCDTEATVRNGVGIKMDYTPKAAAWN